jgi:selenium metabolism protein YedF
LTVFFHWLRSTLDELDNEPEKRRTMHTEQLDCRGLACPSPVLKTKEIIDRGVVQHLTVLVDNPAASENVTRLLSRSGFQVGVSQQEGAFAVTGDKSPSGSVCEVAVEGPEAGQKQKILVLLGTDRLGRGDDDLGRRLVINFLGTLNEMGQELWRLVLVNGGVKLALEGSDVLVTLERLVQSGVQLFVCGTCLDHFGVLEQKRVGETTNMLDIVTAMQLADKVISLT